jgi:plasmid maintenance system antidote protein VapI
MKPQSPGAALAARVCARIREFCAARGMSAKALIRAAKLTPTEVALLDAESEEITPYMLRRIAAVFNVHPAVLCMSSDEHAIASMLEAYRDMPKDKFQKLAGELVSRGFHRSRGSA